MAAVVFLTLAGFTASLPRRQFRWPFRQEIQPMSDKSLVARGPAAFDPDIRIIRALAVLMILVCHLFEIYGSFAAWWLNAGVQVFLFISGYVFGGRTVRAWPGWFGRRLERILPPYYLLIAAVFLANALIQGPARLWKPLAASLLGVQDFLKITLPGCDHLWFITLILLCYLMVPALQSLRDRAGRSAAGLALFFFAPPLAFYALYKVFNFLTYNYVANLTAFAWGYGAAAHRDLLFPATPSPHSPSRLHARAFPLILAAIALSLAGRGALEMLHLTTTPPWVGLYDKLLLPWSKVGVAVACFLLVRGRGAGLAQSRPVALLDAYSYEIYLTHHIFIFGPLSVVPWIPSIPLAVLAVAALTALASLALRRACLLAPAGWKYFSKSTPPPLPEEKPMRVGGQ